MIACDSQHKGSLPLLFRSRKSGEQLMNHLVSNLKVPQLQPHDYNDPTLHSMLARIVLGLQFFKV